MQKPNIVKVILNNINSLLDGRMNIFTKKIESKFHIYNNKPIKRLMIIQGVSE